MVWSSDADGFFLFGGHELVSDVRRNDLHFYDRQGNSWSALSPSGTKPNSRNSATMVWSPTADGFYVFAGYVTAATNDLHFYDRQANSWSGPISYGGAAVGVRFGAQGVWSSSEDGFYIFGGAPDYSSLKRSERF